MNHKPSPRPQLRGQLLVRHPPHTKRRRERPQPAQEHIVVAQLLRNHADTRRGRLLRIHAPQPTRIHARLHQRRHERLVVHAIAGNHSVETRCLRSARHSIRLPVQRTELDHRRRRSTGLALGGRRRVGVEVALYEALDVGLVGEDVARYAAGVGEGEGVEGGDAAAEFEDGGGGGEEGGGEEGVLGMGEPGGEDGGDFPEDWER